MAVHQEVERAYPAPESVELPALVDLVDSGGVPLSESTTTARLSATYFDTDDLRLGAAGLTLRRRTGGEDAGWHLKIPARSSGSSGSSGSSRSRAEVRHPPGKSTRVVPAPLRALVRAVTGGATLRPVAEVVTQRRASRLVDATGRVLLELADDHVTARRLHVSAALGDVVHAPLTWREVEIELVDGDEELLDVVEAGLRAAGLGPARSGSKVGQVLDAPRRRPAPAPGTRSSAGEVLVAYLTAQVDAVVAQDLAVRLRTPDSVHRMRVATRRLRSALSTYGRLLARTVTDPLRDELRWLGGELGTARDAEVLRDRVADLDAGAATVAELDERERAAAEAVLVVLDGDRYHALLRDLRALVAEPPLRGRARRRARRVLPDLVARRDRAVRRAVRRARRGPRGRVDDLLHDARKRARTARYAAEVARPAVGADAKAYARAMEAVQEVLGAHQDSVVARERWTELAASTTDVATAFRYGQLHAQDEARGRASREQVRAVWRRARRPRLRRWLG